VLLLSVPRTNKIKYCFEDSNKMFCFTAISANNIFLSLTILKKKPYIDLIFCRYIALDPDQGPAA